MAFQPTIIFAVGYKDTTIPGSPVPVLQTLQSNLPISVTFQGAAGVPVGNAVSVTNDETDVIHEAFVLSNGLRASLTTVTADLSFDWSRYHNNLDTSAQNALLDQFAAGGRITLDVTIATVAGTHKLPIEVRMLKTSDFLIGFAGANVHADPAHSPFTAGNNLVVPGGDSLANYHFTCAELNIANVAAANDAGRLAVNAATAPANVSNRVLTVHANAVPSVDGLDLAATVTADCDLTIDLHLPTEVAVQLDRSGSMNKPTTGGTKWDAAKAAANLFAQLYGDAIPNLSGPNSNVLDSKKIVLGRFRWPAPFTYTPNAGFDDASNKPSVPGAETAGGGTPIGQALTDADSKFDTANTGWRRRHIVLLTDGMHNSGAPNLSAPATGVPSAGADNVVIHAISYALVGETAMPTLDQLRAAHGGLLLGSESDEDELDPEKLRDKFIDILGTIIPINRIGSLDSPSGSVMIDPGVDRAIFVAPGNGGVSASLGAVTTTSSGTANGISWAVADAPPAGLWTLSTPGMAVVDLALFMRSELIPNGVGQPVRVRAQLDFHGQPISGASIRAKVRRPGESVGQLLTGFTRSGGLFQLLANAAAQPILSHVPGLGPAARQFKAVPAALAAVGFPTHDSQDTQSLQRILLDAAEAAREARFKKASDDVILTETATPGVYEGTLPAQFTQEEGLYTFELHAEGTTPGGASFVRDQTRCSTLAPIPAPAVSETLLQQAAIADGQVTWTATVLPRTATRRAVGPGLGYLFGFQWVHEADRKRLETPVTVDNLDGSYSATVTLEKGKRFPPLGLFSNGPAAAKVEPVVVSEKSQDAHYVKVTLDRIQVMDDKDPCLKGRGELAFDSVVAPNGSASRAVRTRIPEQGVIKLASGEAFEPKHVIFEGYVEPEALLSVTIGGSEFDWFLFFQQKEQLTRYHRTIRPKPGVQRYAPDDEVRDPEAKCDWNLWYTVEVSG